MKVSKRKLLQAASVPYHTRQAVLPGLSWYKPLGLHAFTRRHRRRKSFFHTTQIRKQNANMTTTTHTYQLMHVDAPGTSWYVPGLHWLVAREKKNEKKKSNLHETRKQDHSSQTKNNKNKKRDVLGCSDRDLPCLRKSRRCKECTRACLGWKPPSRRRTARSRSCPSRARSDPGSSPADPGGTGESEEGTGGQGSSP